jgi:hypothetical protein
MRTGQHAHLLGLCNSLNGRLLCGGHSNSLAKDSEGDDNDDDITPGTTWKAG